MMKLMKLKRWERVLLFRDGELAYVLGPGWHLVSGDAERVDVRDVVFAHEDLDLISRSPVLAGEARVLHPSGSGWRMAPAA